MITISETKIKHYLMFELIGRLDTTNYQEVDMKLTDAINRGNLNILLNCAGLEYISSSGLRVFLISLKKITTANGNLLISGLNPMIREVFDISGFSGIFKIFDNQEEAVKNF